MKPSQPTAGGSLHSHTPFPLGMIVPFNVCLEAQVTSSATSPFHELEWKEVFLERGREISGEKKESNI